jgi:hypothetical protein
MKYKVGVIDDEESTSFFLDELNSDFEFIQLEIKDIGDVIDNIMSKKLDALIIDYNLENSTNFIFSGNDVLDYLHCHLMGFPAVILTGYGIEAENNNESPFIVFEKKRILDSENNNFENNKNMVEFTRKFIICIENYKKRINDAEKRYSELNEIPTDKLTPEEEAELVRIDDFLDRTFSGDAAINRRYKETTFERNLVKLIDKTEQMIEKFSHE